MLTGTVWADTVWLDVWGPVWAASTSPSSTPNKTFGLSSMINQYGASVDCTVSSSFGLDSAIVTTTGLSSIVNPFGIGLDGTATSTSGYSGEL